MKFPPKISYRPRLQIGKLDISGSNSCLIRCSRSLVRYASHRANVISGRLDCLIANPNLKRQASRVCGNSPSCCGPGVTLGWVWWCTLWRVMVYVGSRLPWMSGRSHVGWTTSRGGFCCRLGVVIAYVTSLETTTARLFPAVCAACQLSLVRSNAWHLTAQLLVPAKLWRATVRHVLLVTELKRKSWFGTLASEYTKSMLECEERRAGYVHCRLPGSHV